MLALTKEEAISIFTHPILESFHSEILDLLKISRGPVFCHPKGVFDFQNLIITKRIEQVETKLSTLPDGDQNKRAYQYIIRIYKWIMDGIALRMLGFNPNAYRILSDNRAAGFIINKEGKTQEVKELENLAKQGFFAISGDLTNFVRICDIFKWKRGEIELIEVKKSKTTFSKTLSLQEKKMKAGENMINNNICVLKDGHTGIIEATKVTANTFKNKVKALILKADRDGISWDDVDACIKISVIDFKKCSELKVNIEEELKKFPNFPKEDEKAPFSNIDLAFCKEGEFFRGAFPPTVLKLPCRLIADLLCGQKLVTIYFSFTKFFNLFRNKGFSIEYDFKDKKNKGIDERFSKKQMPLEKSTPDSAVKIKKNGWEMELPDTIIPRICYEYLHPRSALKLMEYVYGTRYERKPGYYLPLFRNHKNLYL